MNAPSTNSPPAAAESGTIDDFERAADVLRQQWPARHPQLRMAVDLLDSRRFGAAAKLTHNFLRAHPRDVTALYLAGKAESGLARHEQARGLFARCVEIVPDFTGARYAVVTEYIALHKPELALAEAEALLQCEPANPVFRFLKALSLESLGDHVAAVSLWGELAREFPSRAEIWEPFSRALRMVGRLDDSIAACRRHLALNPSSAIGWWNLADIKTFRFEPFEVEKMEALLAGSDRSATERAYLHFALGNAYRNLKRFDKSFANYARGKALYRLANKYDPEILTGYIERCRSTFTRDFFGTRSTAGCPAPDPIFVVGMQRAGSTLVEQILASHSRIEGTAELSYIDGTINRLTNELQEDYPALLAALDVSAFAKLGQDYLEQALHHRVLRRPFFIDKMGGNFMHVGLIHLILPNARVIDVRRHPMACCFSNFSQVYLEPARNSSTLSDIGRHYRDYVQLMAHYDAVLPGKVYRVIYEELVDSPECVIRGMLDYLDLPFEQACMEFHKTERVVRTVSTEQVRRPINRDGLEQWRNYEPWLQPLNEMLGEIVDQYPQVPAFD